MEKKKMTFGARVKEAFRKFIVGLKRKPQNIAMVAFVITFLQYALNLTKVSNTTAKINLAPMGLCGFITMLFSILSLVCFLNAFPRRKPANKPILIIMFVMVAAIIGADILYMSRVDVALNEKLAQSYDAWYNYIIENWYIYQVRYYVLITHIVMVLVSVALTALLPIYSKLIRRIKTSVEVEENEDMGVIDISGED